MALSKPERLAKRRYKRDRLRRWFNKVHKLQVGVIVCSCSGHLPIKTREISYWDGKRVLDLELTLDSGGTWDPSCSAWSCGVIPAGKSCCSSQTRNKITHYLQKVFQGAPRLSKNNTYAQDRAFYLYALMYARKAPKHVIKGFQKDLARIRRGHYENR